MTAAGSLSPFLASVLAIQLWPRSLTETMDVRDPSSTTPMDDTAHDGSVASLGDVAVAATAPTDTAESAAATPSADTPAVAPVTSPPPQTMTPTGSFGAQRTIRVQINHEEQDVNVNDVQPPTSTHTYVTMVETYVPHSSQALQIEHRVRKLSSADVNDRPYPVQPASPGDVASAFGGSGKELATGTSSSGPQLTRMQNFCINASFGVNVTLVVIKLIAAIVSASIVVVASALDSALDILFVSWLCRRGRGRVLTSLR